MPLSRVATLILKKTHRNMPALRKKQEFCGKKTEEHLS